jgi:hypothetical protein
VASADCNPGPVPSLPLFSLCPCFGFAAARNDVFRAAAVSPVDSLRASSVIRVDMSQNVSPIIKEHFTTESTDGLLKIWETNDTNVYSPSAFAAIDELLRERGVTPPTQGVPPPPSAMPVTPGRKQTKRGIKLLLLSVGLTIVQGCADRSFPEPDSLRLTIGSFLGLMAIGGSASIIDGCVTEFRHRSRT